MTDLLSLGTPMTEVLIAVAGLSLGVAATLGVSRYKRRAQSRQPWAPRQWGAGRLSAVRFAGRGLCRFLGMLRRAVPGRAWRSNPSSRRVRTTGAQHWDDGLPLPDTEIPTQSRAISRGVSRSPARSSRRAWLWSESTGQEHLLPPEAAKVGRSRDNDIVLEDRTVSRHHAVLRYGQGAWWLLPEVTSNGTFCNDVIVQPGERRRLGSGDVIRLGTDIELRLVAPVDEALRFRAAARTTPGARRVNEDSHLATDDTLAVADGVGGRSAGRIASRVAIHVVATMANDVPVDVVVQDAHKEVVRQASSSPSWEGMATTLDVVRLVRDEDWVLVGGHVGDGLVILQRGDETTLLTAPDRLGDRLEVQDPDRAQLLRDDPDYDRLASGLGFRSPPTPQLWRRSAEPGQRLLLASDGLLDVLSVEDLSALLRRNQHRPAEAVADLLLSLSADAPDNVTVVVADLESGVSDEMGGRFAGSPAEHISTDSDTMG